MIKLFSKFKFKWWSWEIDTAELLLLVFLALGFLPILPYEKKDGKLISVLGIEASNNNFYNLNPYEDKKISQIVDFNIDYAAHKNYLLDRGYSKKKAECILKRDFLTFEAHYSIELNKALDKYAVSPVPFIWLTKTIINDAYKRAGVIDISFESFDKFTEKCKEFGDLVPPPGYLNNKFNYQNIK
tara:strand:+ start:32 stop:586 length:555 start_codon:yes stop_codon:yes gene_type:complete